MLNRELQGHKDSWVNGDPAVVLLYRLKWAQLSSAVALNNLKILDFGSGFGTTANYLAKDNDVTAIEPNADMVEARERENNYTQIIGGYEKLSGFGNDSFDVAVCHNVLEFAEERSGIVREFSRILKRGGVLSVVKNNNCGRIMSKVIFENNIETALDLLDGGYIANTFGKVIIYNPDDLAVWGEELKIEKLLALRTFFGARQRYSIDNGREWIENMFKVEMKVCDMEPYKSVSLFNHVLLRKI